MLLATFPATALISTMSESGTFATCRMTLRMSASRGFQILEADRRPDDLHCLFCDNPYGLHPRVPREVDTTLLSKADFGSRSEVVDGRSNRRE